MRRYAILLAAILIAVAVVAILLVTRQGDSGEQTLAVTWVSNGDLFYWDSQTEVVKTLTKGDIEGADISPSGEFVVFNRVSEDDGDSFWYINTAAGSEKAFEVSSLAQYGWLDGETLLYSVLDGDTPSGGFVHFQMNLVTGETRKYPVAGEVIPNPSRTGALVVSMSGYAPEPGEMWYIDLDHPDEPVKLHEFELIMGGSPVRYTRPVWLDDETFLYAQPSQNFNEHLSGVTTDIWRVKLSGEAELLGSRAGWSFILLPVWSSDGSKMLFTIIGPWDDPKVKKNDWAQVIANGDGSDPQILYANSIEDNGPNAVSFLMWIDNRHFVFTRDDSLWLADLDGTERRWIDEIYALPRFAQDGVIVYRVQTENEDKIELRTARLEDEGYTTIAAVTGWNGVLSATLYESR